MDTSSLLLPADPTTGYPATGFPSAVAGGGCESGGGGGGSGSGGTAKPDNSARVTLRVAVLSRAVPARRTLNAATWALGQELGLSACWLAAGGVEAVVHGIATGVSCVPPPARDARDAPCNGAGMGSLSGTVKGDAPLSGVGAMQGAAVGALAAALAHEDGFLYIALRFAGGQGE